MFQQIIYVKSPPAEYWKVGSADKFERILEQAVLAAKRYGAMVVEGIVFWTRIAPFRQGDWHYKDDLNSSWRFLLDWE
eukprot:9839004-Lingulodinium_polyedra.AAC.1